MKTLLFFILFFVQLTEASTRIMPLGDSITFDDSTADHTGTPRPNGVRHAYRNYLWYKLRNAGYSVNFVGTRIAGQDVSPPFDPENQGYPGYTSNQIANLIYGKLQQTSPDIILLHIGSNDWSSSTSGINSILNEIDRYERNYNHHIKVILAKIIQRKDYQSWTHSLNNNIGSLANSRNNNGDDIYIVNMETGAGLNYNSDLRDRVHPTPEGYNKMATVWFNKLKGILNSKPAKPTNFSYTQSSTSVNLSWNDNSNNERGFKIWKSNTRIATLGANVTSTTINNLTPNTTYTFEIRASNDNGNSAADYVTFKTLPPPIPYKPTNFTSTKVTPYSITLHWSDNSTNEKGFKIWNGNKRIATLGANVTSKTIKNLQPRTTYIFEIRSYNNNGNSARQVIKFTTKDDYAWFPAVYHLILN